MEAPVLPPASALEQLERVLASDTFRSAGRSSRLLRFLVEHAVSGQADRLKEYTIGAEALQRGERFDPRIDSIARVEVSRLRNRLERYYASEGRADPVTIFLSKGDYVPAFETRSDAGVSQAHARRILWYALGGTAMALLLAAALWFPRRVPQPANRPLMQLEVELLQGSQLANVVGTDLAISPTGPIWCSSKLVRRAGPSFMPVAWTKGNPRHLSVRRERGLRSFHRMANGSRSGPTAS